MPSSGVRPRAQTCMESRRPVVAIHLIKISIRPTLAQSAGPPSPCLSSSMTQPCHKAPPTTEMFPAEPPRPFQMREPLFPTSSSCFSLNQTLVAPCNPHFHPQKPFIPASHPLQPQQPLPAQPAPRRTLKPALSPTIAPSPQPATPLQPQPAFHQPHLQQPLPPQPAPRRTLTPAS